MVLVVLLVVVQSVVTRMVWAQPVVSHLLVSAHDFERAHQSASLAWSVWA